MELTEQGFYELRARDKDVVVVAANVDPAEGDLTPMDPKEIAAAAVGGGDSAGGTGSGITADAGGPGAESTALVVPPGGWITAARGRHC